MKEREARNLLKELFERHCVSSIPIVFHPKPLITKGEDIPKLKEIGLGHLAAAVTVTTMGVFKVNLMTNERSIEFYGLPREHTVRHEFKHYLNHLGVAYVRKRAIKSCPDEGSDRCCSNFCPDPQGLFDQGLYCPYDPKEEAEEP